MSLLKSIFGDASSRELKSIYPIVDKVEALADEYKAMTDAQLQAKTPEFRERLQHGETLDDILPEAFAAVREAADRVLGMRPYRVQLVGGVVLHQGRIAEMKTGEGKTLVATLPAYLNALAGRGVHIVTVNDYLAKRDSEWMGKVHRFLGLKVGLIIHGLSSKERQEAYAADITYGTNNEMGFDYLRDNMCIYASELVQRGHAFAIVDEVDSILIDEARTPLIISGQGDKSTQLYTIVDSFVARLKGQRVTSVDTKEEEDPDIDADYIVDEKARTVTLTARGIAKAEQQFQIENLSDPENTTLSHHINQAIRARGLMKRDIDYVVKDGEVIIVDEFTGRLMYGRRYSEGLHQAIEAKEGVLVREENQTLATITEKSLHGLDEVLEKAQPDIVLVHGDTSTTFAGALAAFYHKIPVGHVEAGLRTYDKYSPFPEEMNRKLTGQIATLHFAPTPRNRDNLAREGITEGVSVVGNTVVDAIHMTVKPDFSFRDEQLKKLDFENNRVVLVTAHRRENYGEPMENICRAIAELSEAYPDVHFVYPVHLSPYVRETAEKFLGGNDRIHLIHPLTVDEMHNLMARCFMIMTDSGGLQEEAPSLGKPVLVLRRETERAEAIEAGTVKLAGVEQADIVKLARELFEDETAYAKMAHAVNPYGDGKTSQRIVEAIEHYFGLRENGPAPFNP